MKKPRRLSLVKVDLSNNQEALTTITAADGVYSTFLRAGQDAPMFSAFDTMGRLQELARYLVGGAVVLSFQRGDWCTYSTASLQALMDAYDRIVATGATLIFVVPSHPLHSPPASKEGQGALMIVDTSAGVARSFGLTYSVPQELRALYGAHGYAPYESIDHDGWDMSVPATYVIDRFGEIVVAYLDLDYRSPMNPNQLLKVLRDL